MVNKRIDDDEWTNPIPFFVVGWEPMELAEPACPYQQRKKEQRYIILTDMLKEYTKKWKWKKRWR